MEEEFKAQLLSLSPNLDDKRWVAEITNDDPTFRLKRVFLPEYREGLYEIYDGVYQIHGIYTGITPFNKEYCIVKDGHMQRYVPVQQIYQMLPEIKAYEGQRKNRIKFQIRQILEEISQTVNHEHVREAMIYQFEQLDYLESSEQLTVTLGQLLKQKDSLIKSYQEHIKLYKEWEC